MRVLLWGVSSSAGFRRALNALGRAGFNLTECVGFRNCLPALRAAWVRGNVIVAAAPAPLAVRAVAPLIKGKELDPALVAVTPSGSAAVPLLNEHWGGAFMCEVLERLGCVESCVQTSLLASEGVMSPDDLAFRLRSRLTSGRFEGVRRVVEALVRGEAPKLFLDSHAHALIRGLADPRVDALLRRAELAGSPVDADLCIASKPVAGCGGPAFTLKRVAAGAGFCSVAGGEDVLRSLDAVLNLLGLPRGRVEAVAVPARRAGHPAVRLLRDAGFRVVLKPVGEAARFGVPSRRGGRFGVRSVAEALARSVLGGGTALIVKALFTNVTVSLVEGR